MRLVFIQRASTDKYASRPVCFERGYLFIGRSTALRSLSDGPDDRLWLWAALFVAIGQSETEGANAPLLLLNSDGPLHEIKL